MTMASEAAIKYALKKLPVRSEPHPGAYSGFRQAAAEDFDAGAAAVMERLERVCSEVWLEARQEGDMTAEAAANQVLIRMREPA